MGGFPAIQTRFATRCRVADPANVTSDWICEFNPGDVSFIPPAFSDGDRVVIIEVDVPGGPVTIVVQSPAPSFDTYWTEVAMPILDSIEFLDR